MAVRSIFCKFLHMMTPVGSILFLLSASITYSYGIPLSVGRVGIFGGHSISIKDAPYIVSLRIFNITANNTQHLCGASIISERFILTAAHCVYPSESMVGLKYKVLVGTDKLRSGDVFYDVDEIIGHENFTFFTRYYDIAIAKVSKPIELGPKVAKILLPDADSDVADGTMVNATGWGTTESDPQDLSNDLLQVSIPVVNREKCGEELEEYLIVDDRVICAGSAGKDTCQGDSGGPLTLGNTLIGITSFGIECGASSPGVYTNVADMLPWIEEKMKTL